MPISKKNNAHIESNYLSISSREKLVSVERINQLTGAEFGCARARSRFRLLDWSGPESLLVDLTPFDEGEKKCPLTKRQIVRTVNLKIARSPNRVRPSSLSWFFRAREGQKASKACNLYMRSVHFCLHSSLLNCESIYECVTLYARKFRVTILTRLLQRWIIRGWKVILKF